MNQMIDTKTLQAQTTRELTMTAPGMPTSDGAGVKLTRIIGTPQINMLDPFLLLDCFESDDANDYIGGFPTHPHRGFETVTYMLDGAMRHKDSKGNEGVIEPGGVQWMTAGKGILHSEMPEQQEGLLKGFQLWVNLPRSVKMSEPAYQEFPADKVAEERHSDGTYIRVIAGKTGQGTVGPVVNDHTFPTYMDITIPAGVTFEQPIDSAHNAFVYVIEGALAVGEQAKVVGAKTLGVFHQGNGEGDQISVTAQSETRFMLAAGKPLNEPVARGGPFVMNTREEINQAFDDFRRGQF